jgi:hypothetical protein
VPTILIVLGLVMIAVGLLVRLIGCAVRIAIPAGILLAIIGIVWHLMGG